MPSICKVCRRVNPGEAAYCYHDGGALTAHAGSTLLDSGSRPFAMPFVFPSGRASGNFDQLARACHEEAAAALELLRAGILEAFLAAQGRIDLALAAKAAARAGEQGLDEFLGRLPVTGLTPPRLRLERAVIDLGVMRAGQDHRFELVLHNDGMRLLSGSADCSECAWLLLGDGPGQKNKLLQFTGRSTLVVRVKGRHLRAYPKIHEGEIHLDTNGGTATVTVRVQVPVKPFPEGVLAGARTPRELAHKAHGAPTDAAALIESGAVARWYTDNGWPYPVFGPTATGLAAVQQLFEALGLVKPPPVELSEDAINLRGAPGERVEHVLVAVTQENRAAVAHGTSDQPWLRVGMPFFRGRTAILPLTIPAVSGRPGETVRANVTVIANGRQRFVVPLSVTVGPAPVAPAPVSPPRPQVRTKRPGR